MKKNLRLLLALLPLLLLAGCSRNVEEKALALVLGSGEKAEGTFTGTLEGLDRTGSGLFRSSDGWTFEGEIRQGVLVSGEGTGVPLAVEAAGETLEGAYTGGLEEGLPQGEGTFQAAAAGEASGTFDSGPAACRGGCRPDRLFGVPGHGVPGRLYRGSGGRHAPGGGEIFRYFGEWLEAGICRRLGRRCARGRGS